MKNWWNLLPLSLIKAHLKNVESYCPDSASGHFFTSFASYIVLLSRQKIPAYTGIFLTKTNCYMKKRKLI